MADRRSPRRPRPLAGAVSRLRSDLAPPTLLGKVQQGWREALGEQIDGEARPVSEREGIITVSCSSATWSAELTMLSGDLLERLNRSLGGPPQVRGLKFTTDPR